MKNIPYDKDCPLQRVEEGDAVEISVMHFPNKLVRDKDMKKYGHIPDGVYHAVAVAPYKLKCEQHPELSGYYNYWHGDKRGCSDGILYKTSHISNCPYCGRYLQENYIN